MNPTTKERPPPPRALVWLCWKSLSKFPPHTAPFIIMVAACRQSLSDGTELHIQVNSQPERFLDYSLFIPVIPPAVVWSLRKMCVWVREARANELRASMLVVNRLGAALLSAQTISSPTCHSAWFRPIIQHINANVEEFTDLSVDINSLYAFIKDSHTLEMWFEFWLATCVTTLDRVCSSSTRIQCCSLVGSEGVQSALVLKKKAAKVPS